MPTFVPPPPDAIDSDQGFTPPPPIPDDVTSPEGGDGFLAKINAALQKPSPAWLQAPEQATREFVGGMVPHDLSSYLASIYPPLGAAKQGMDLGEGLSRGDISGIPLVGRIPEIMQADETPAGSKERYLTTMKTLMDLGMLAGGGEGAREPIAPETPPVQPPPIPEEYQGRFTMVPPAPEQPPQFVPPPPIEQTLSNIGQPPPFNPELGPQPQPPDFQMPLQTDMAQSPNAQPLFPTPPPGTPLKGTPLVGPNGETPAAKVAAQAAVPPEVQARVANLPEYMQHNVLDNAARLEKSGVADQIEELAAQRLTAKQISDKLGIPIEDVMAIRITRGIPSMNAGGAVVAGYGGGPQFSPEFEAWVKSRQAPQPAIQPGDERYAGVTPQGTGISQAATEAELGPGSVEPGIGAELGSGLEHGRNYVNKGGDPRLPIRRANTSGMVGAKDVGIVHAELERLRGERSRAAAALEASPDDPVLQQNFSNADNAQRAWRKELQPVLTKASDSLREAQAMSMPNADVSTYQGLADLMDEHFKGQRELSDEDRTALTKAAKGVKGVRDIANGEMKKVEGELTRKMGGKKVMSPAELDADLRKELEGQFSDCFLGK